MAPLTWRNVDAPDFSRVSDILNNAGNSWQSSFKGIGDEIGDIRDRQKRNRSMPAIDALLNAATEQDAAAALKAVPGMVGNNDRSDMLINAMAAARGNTLGYESSRAGTLLTGAQTGEVNQNTTNLRDSNGRANTEASRADTVEDNNAAAGRLAASAFGAPGVLSLTSQRMNDGAPSWLVDSESGGNFAARNDAEGSSGRDGHFGRVQFGQDRFDEAKAAGVVPKEMSIQQVWKVWLTLVGLLA
jgi:hypothetical protein